MIPWCTNLIQSLAQSYGITPAEVADTAAVLIVFIHMMSLMPLAGYLVPRNLGMAGWIRLWPYWKRPLIIYGVFLTLLAVPTAILLLAQVPPDPPTTDATIPDRKPAAQSRGAMLALGWAIPGIFGAIIVGGLVAGQPTRQVRLAIGPGEGRSALDRLNRALSSDGDWKQQARWTTGANRETLWLGQGMPLNPNASSEAALATGMFTKAPRRSLFLSVLDTPTGSILVADFRLLDIVLAKTKLREAAWIADAERRFLQIAENR
jgi:hypothetical protein